MAQLIRADRLILLVQQAAARGAAFAWIDPELGLSLGDEFGKARFSIDIGRETLVARMAEAAGPAGIDIGSGTLAARMAGPASSAAIDAALRPAPAASAAIWPETSGGRHTGSFIVTLDGARYAATSQKQMLLVGLQAVERMRPGTLQKLSEEKARTKRVVSRDRLALNDDQRLAQKFSQRIEGGWWVFTNNSFNEAKKFVLRAAFHAGLSASVERAA